MANRYRSVLAGASAKLQTKTVTAGTTASTVNPDSGYDGMSSVTVNPTPSETKTVTAGMAQTTVTPTSGKLLSSVTVDPTPSQAKSATPSTTAQTITPDTGYLLSSVSVGAIQTQTKSATPSTTAQTITPDSGKFLSSVSVGAIQTQTKSATPSTSAQTITPDSGYYLSSVSVGAISTQEKTSTPTTRSATAATVTPDSGKFLSKVTVDTNSVPNSNSAVKTITSSDTNWYTGNVDMGATNSYRYVNAVNVYNKGKSDATIITGGTFDGLIIGGTWGVGSYQTGIDMITGTVTANSGSAMSTTHVSSDGALPPVLTAKTDGYYVYNVSGITTLTKGNLNAGATIQSTPNVAGTPIVGVMIYLGPKV